MSLHLWLRVHALDWQIWVPAALLFSGVLVWARARPRVWIAVPWIFLLFWLASAGAGYLHSDWHRVLFLSRRLWAGGVVALALTAAIPLGISMATEARTATRLRSPAGRVLVAALAGICVNFLVHSYVSHWTQVLIRGW